MVIFYLVSNSFNSGGANHYRALKFLATANTANDCFWTLEHRVKDTDG